MNGRGRLIDLVIQGSCHCGNIAFALDWGGDPAEIPTRACDCTFCMKHGGVWTSSPKGKLRVTVKDRSLASRYSFGTHTADFHVCSRCGIVPLVTSDIDGRTYAVVSVRAFNEVDPSLFRQAPVSFEGEEVGSRLARRQRNWISDVRIED